jgi:hypothetical protein
MPAISSAAKARYGFADGSGNRASTRLPLGLSEKGMRTQPERFEAE